MDYRTATIERSPQQSTVVTSGTVNPVVLVRVGKGPERPASHNADTWQACRQRLARGIFVHGLT